MRVKDIQWILIISLIITENLAATESCFQRQYKLDNFITDRAFKDVTDIAFNHQEQSILVLQRSYPPVTIWSTDGTLLQEWDTQDIGYPHSFIINATSGTDDTTVWITDMAGELAAGNVYGHCIKQFTYTGELIQNIGTCGSNTNGSGLDPVQFDRVTDLALNSKGYMFITDGDIGGINNRVLVFNPDNELIDVWNKENKPGSGPLQFDLPHSISIDWCDRVWITDTNNHRIQIITSDGMFLDEWKCFNDSLIYGIDINHDPNSDSASVMVTTKSSDGVSEVIILQIKVNDCSQIENFGTCKIQRQLVKKDAKFTKAAQSAMLHSVTFDNTTGAMYLSMLPGNFPPLKYSPIHLPPKSEMNACSGSTQPALWPTSWSANILLTPYHADDLHTAQVEYNSNLKAMYTSLNGPKAHVKEFLNVDNITYIITRNSTTTTCSGPYDYGWLTPAKHWLVSKKCECKGALNISGIETVAWTCLVNNQREWYWLHSNGTIWRMMLNDPNTSSGFPVIVNYTMAHFTYETNGDSMLKKVFEICTQRPHEPHQMLTPNKISQPVKGFSYLGCPDTLPNWPEFFHSTVTMVPVSLNNATPFPSQVVYDWDRESQCTIMCTPMHTYKAYMIQNNTYVVNQNLKTKDFECLSHFSFGPPKPNWMTLDGCTCMGTIQNNFSLSPFNKTIIAVCPVTDKRVFWTWFTTDFDFSPLLFFETLTPADEGTGLALADYHSLHKYDIMIDMKELEIPPKCLN